MKTIRTTVSLPSDQLQQLQSLADQHNLSLAWLIRQAVSEFLERVDDHPTFHLLKRVTVKDES